MLTHGMHSTARLSSQATSWASFRQTDYSSVSASISAHSTTHSLQMKTWFGHSPGPPIMRRPAVLDLRQNEQRTSAAGPDLPLMETDGAGDGLRADFEENRSTIMSMQGDPSAGQPNRPRDVASGGNRHSGTKKNLPKIRDV